MKALTWHGKNDIRCDIVADPRIEDGRDAIIKVTACAICGSDLHIFDGVIPAMESGDVLANANTVILMGKIREGSRMGRALHVAKHRGSFCDEGIISYEITPEGLVLRPGTTELKV